MKTPSEDIFLLIRSLIPAEKRYFKVYSDLHAFTGDKKKYIKLFDAIDSLPEYDENELRKKLSGESFATKLKKPKRYLSEAILKSLERYHSNDSVDIILAQKLQRIEILYRKNLNSIALKIIHSALKMAVEHESTLYVLKLLSWKSEILKLSEKINDIKVYINTGFSEEFDQLKMYLDHRRYYELVYRLIPLIKTQQVVRDSGSVEEIKKILRHPLVNKVNKKALPYTLLKYYYNVMSIGTREIGDWKRSHMFRLEVVKYLERDRSKLNLRATPYIQAIHNLLISSKHLNRDKEYDLYFNKAQAFINGLPKKYRTKIILHEYFRLIVSYMENQLRLFNYGKVINVTIEMERLTKDPSLVSIENHLYFYYYAFHAYFNLGEYREALKYLNKIVGFSNNEILQDYVFISWILTLIVHYELGNTELLKGLSKTTQRYLLKKKGKVYKFEMLLIDLFGKLIHVSSSKRDRIEIFKEARQKLGTVFKNTSEAQVLEYFDFLSWLDSKIENRSFAEVVKERAVIVSG
ncbi:MAG: hypothetical protein HYU69_15935 [Bacteroidetes bacterium]|nr:hypothetical protein [Bacteroidota bacterium]